MGPQQHQGSMRYGLGLGHQFGVIANTDHHSAHPGSYGHGVTGIWASSDRREYVWEALNAKRTWAMTGDLMQLKFAVEISCKDRFVVILVNQEILKSSLPAQLITLNCLRQNNGIVGTCLCFQSVKWRRNSRGRRKQLFGLN